MKKALGLIESIGLTTAITALDAASKAADISLVGYEKVIGAGRAVSVTIQIAGEVAAVKASVDAGVRAAEKVGTVLAHHVIPRPHEEVDYLIEAFRKNLKQRKKDKEEQEEQGTTLKGSGKQMREDTNRDQEKEEL